MNNTSPITEEQKALLSRFTCERLTTNRNNLFDIQDFYSEKGEGLVDNLLIGGWKADKKGTTAYYLIKNPDGEIVMFFSLKCGVLFDPDYAEEYLDRFKETFADGEPLRRWERLQDGDETQVQYFQEQYRRMGTAKYNDFAETLRIKTDKKYEPNKKIIRVSEARPAIELVEFCANDNTKGCWHSYNMPPNRKMGETLFWWFIVPKMLAINELIGCEFVYLFAADKTTNGDLSSYYREVLHFNNMTHLGTIKPSYDFNCFFMGNRLRSVTDAPPALRRTMRGLDYYQKAFFDNFNLNMAADDIV